MRSTKIWLFVSAILMVGGIGLAAIGFAKGGTWRMRFDFKNFKLHSGSENFVTKTEKTDSFNKLVVKTDTFDIRVNKGNDHSITYHVPDDRIPVITNENGTLTILAEEESGLSLFNFGSYGDENPYIEITTPEDTKKEIDIESSTGDITITNLSFEGPITTSTGDINLSQSKMGKMMLHVSTGDIFANNCSIESLNTEASTGEVKISDTTCEGGYTAKTSTGDINIKNSEFSSFTANGSTSDITVENSSINDILIDTSTGDVKLGLKGEESEYSSKITTSTGDIEINGKEYEDNYNSSNSGNKSIAIETSTGDVEISFRS